MKEDILGYDIDSVSLHSCVDEIFLHIQSQGRPKWLACMNPHSYVDSCRDNDFSMALKSASWLVPDGIGVVIASKIFGGCIQDRITGFDVFYHLQERMNDNSMSVFFLGSTEETLEIISSRIRIDYPNVRLAGTYSPPFKDDFTQDDIEKMIDAINFSNPDVLWVAMTAPKQEKWICNNIDLLNTHFVGAIGAVFDFYSGKVKRSHPIYQRLGLEWLPRLVQEPTRLWKRTLISSPLFMKDVLLSFISKRF